MGKNRKRRLVSVSVSKEAQEGCGWAPGRCTGLHPGLGCRLEDSGLRVSGFTFRFEGGGFTVWGAGLGVGG